MARRKQDKLPVAKTINIAGRDYTVHRTSIGDNWGLCESATASIHISEDLEETTDLPAEVIELHEVIHACLFETGLCSLLEDRVEEAIVTGLALQLHRAGYRRSL
jgi:nicotinamidase-related amidase